MQRINQEKGSYRVILIGIEDDTEEKRESFCKKISENYSISLPLLKKIIDHCPTILLKNLFRNKAETLAKTLQSFGAIVSVEEKRDSPPIYLEFQEMAPHQVALESSDLQKTQSGAWNIIGRAKNISEESLNDTWVLIQIFNGLEDLLNFEEAPIPNMSDKNSRISVRWMHELIPDVVRIDFSNTPINIEESLYRVASRLGVVDPHFDYYQGRNSIGDLKIQSLPKKPFLNTL